MQHTVNNLWEAGKHCAVSYQVTCTPRPIWGRYVTIHLPGQRSLALRDVKVYGGIGESTLNYHWTTWFCTLNELGISPRTWTLCIAIYSCHVLITLQRCAPVIDVVRCDFTNHSNYLLGKGSCTQQRKGSFVEKVIGKYRTLVYKVIRENMAHCSLYLWLDV